MQADVTCDGFFCLLTPGPRSSCLFASHSCRAASSHTSGAVFACEDDADCSPGEDIAGFMKHDSCLEWQEKERRAFNKGPPQPDTQSLGAVLLLENTLRLALYAQHLTIPVALFVHLF